MRDLSANFNDSDTPVSCGTAMIGLSLSSNLVHLLPVIPVPEAFDISVSCVCHSLRVQSIQSNGAVKPVLGMLKIALTTRSIPQF